MKFLNLAPMHSLPLGYTSLGMCNWLLWVLWTQVAVRVYTWLCTLDIC